MKRSPWSTAACCRTSRSSASTGPTTDRGWPTFGVKLSAVTGSQQKPRERCTDQARDRRDAALAEHDVYHLDDEHAPLGRTFVDTFGVQATTDIDPAMQTGLTERPRPPYLRFARSGCLWDLTWAGRGRGRPAAASVVSGASNRSALPLLCVDTPARWPRGRGGSCRSACGDRKALPVAQPLLLRICATTWARSPRTWPPRSGSARRCSRWISRAAGPAVVGAHVQRPAGAVIDQDRNDRRREPAIEFDEASPVRRCHTEALAIGRDRRRGCGRGARALPAGRPGRDRAVARVSGDLDVAGRGDSSARAWARCASPSTGPSSTKRSGIACGRRR